MQINRHFFITILVMICVTRLGSSIYLPALPAMKESFGVSLHALNATLTLFFIAYALATLVAGPIIDSFGRRIVIRYGIVFFILGSVLCGFAEEMPQLWLGRIIQAIGVALVPVSGRVMVSDLYSDRKMLVTLGWISVISSISPILATVLGGFIVDHFGWQATFHLLSVTAVAVLFFGWKQLPETLTEKADFRLTKTFVEYGTILRSARFSLIVLPVCLCFALQGVYFATGPYIFISIFKQTPMIFGVCNLFLLAAMIAGRPLSVFLYSRHSPFAAYFLSALLSAIGGLLLFLGTYLDWIGPIRFIIATAIFCLGFGAMVPVCLQSILSCAKEKRGKISALFGFSTFGAMGLGSFLVGLFNDSPMGSLHSMSALALLLGLLTLPAVFFRSTKDTLKKSENNLCRTFKG